MKSIFKIILTRN